MKNLKSKLPQSFLLQPERLSELGTGVEEREQLLFRAAARLYVDYAAEVDFRGDGRCAQWTVEFGRRHGAVPVWWQGMWWLALVDPFDARAVGECLAADPELCGLVVVDPERVVSWLEREESAGAVVEEGPADELPGLPELLQAVYAGASDLHLEKRKGQWMLRMRLDDSLHPLASWNDRRGEAIAVAWKARAGISTGRLQRPQDGKLRLQVEGSRAVDFRMSALPLHNGESLVLRILDNARRPQDWCKLGWTPEQAERIRVALACMNGWICLTGTTGAGKTTTLYSLLGALVAEDRKILTAEDPVEYPVRGIVQTEVGQNTKWSYPQAIRCFLRQDPDIIAVGEIRSAETALASVRAAQTGHLVLSTLHADSVSGARMRLEQYGAGEAMLAGIPQWWIHQKRVGTKVSFSLWEPDGQCEQFSE